MGLSLHKKRLDELTTQDVFVVEQDCVYQDMDYDDQPAIHLWLTDEEDWIVALCRVCPAGTHMDEVSIGLKDS